MANEAELKTPAPEAPGPVRLLRQIRDVMARKGDAQERLDSLVDIIAANLRAEVCSIYLRRSGGSLELCATEGLKAEAVHATRLNAGEGLVGWVAQTARPLSTISAQEHPAFSYRPETGEDAYQTFLGVPILRGGRLLGVLVVQSVEKRGYREDEIETLQTIAMVLAEVIASGDLLDTVALEGIELRPSRFETLQGRAFAGGIAIGTALVHKPHVSSTRLIADDPDAEEQRLRLALGQLQSDLDRWAERDARVGAGLTGEVFDTYRMFARDPAWTGKLFDAVRSGLTAEAAVERARNEQRARLTQTRDAFFSDRLHDLEDIANRTLRYLSGEDTQVELPENAILIARHIGPADLLEYGAGTLKGVALEEGSASGHAAIVARALGIPLVGRLDDALDRAEDGDVVILDGESGAIHLRPSDEVLESYTARVALRGKRQAEFARLRHRPSRTRDGQDAELMLNAGLLVDLPQMGATGADGMGLFRTEFQFMIAEQLPRLEAQIEVYSQVLDAARDKPVIFRTLDLGGDKILPYVSSERERNPALGWRAIRMSLDRKGLLRYQLRALMTASAGRELNVMFPMLATVGEYRAARALALKEFEWARSRGRPVPDKLNIGAMVETPAFAWALPSIMDETDFVSVGVNDLFQFFFAADRDHPRLTDRYDALDPYFLTMLARIRDICAEHGVPAGVCGEMSGRPLEAMALLGLGFRRLSMPPSGFGPVKAMALQLDAKSLAERLQEVIRSDNGSTREFLKEYAAQSNFSGLTHWQIG